MAGRNDGAEFAPWAGDQATVSVLVALNPTEAFAIFTRETDLWWRRGMQYRVGGRQPGTLSFEPRLGGRLFEQYETASGPQLYEYGRITAWDPPLRLAFEWRNTNFSAHERTEVEVQFEPAGSGTRVTVRHRGWASLRPGHPARHGLQGAAVSRMTGLWWGQLLTALREFIDRKP